jgi:hypothetical protein
MAINALGIIALLSFLMGALLALRWSVLALLPAIGAALVLVVLLSVARGEGAGSLAIDLLVTVTCMEAGYIARLVAYALADVARVAVTTTAEAKSFGARAPVIAGLDPAIHPLRKNSIRRGWTRGSSPRVTAVVGADAE